MNMRRQTADGTTQNPSGRTAPARRPDSAARPLPSASRAAFTLTELLVVIGIIVLLLVLAVPAFNLLSGSRSIDGAENNLSALLGRARAEAIGLQRETGVMFFIDPATEGVMGALVYKSTETGPTADAREVYLDVVDGVEFLPLPRGVMLQVIDDAGVAGKTRSDDGYMGFNQLDPPPNYTGEIRKVGGVILFDASGRLVSRSYGFDLTTDPPTGTGVPTAMNRLLFNPPATGVDWAHAPAFLPDPPVQTPPLPPRLQRSAFGFVLIDGQAFKNNGSDTDPQFTGPVNSYAANEAGEENWIDENGTPVLINRYNGTLVRGD